MADLNFTTATFNELVPADQALLIALIVEGATGCLVNCFLLLIIFKKKGGAAQSEYMAFVVNRTLVDIAFCFNLMTISPLGVYYWTSQPIYCHVAGILTNSIGLMMVACEPVLALNRYVSMCHSNKYKKIYQKRNVYLMCACAWILGFLTTIPSIITGNLGKTPGIYCAVKITRESFLIVLLSDYPVFLLSYAVVLFCYYKIFRMLKKHQTHADSNNQMRSRLQEDRAILRYIGAVAVLPLITESPVAIAAFFRMYAPSMVPDMGMFGTNFFYMFCPSVNPILTLLMVKPIRTEAIRLMRRLVMKKNEDMVMQIHTVGSRVQPQVSKVSEIGMGIGGR